MYSQEKNETPLGSALINGLTVVMRTEQLRHLLQAHQELTEKRVGVAGKIGFLGNSELTAGWRSPTLQTQLVARGVSTILSSNHRRGVSVDSHEDRAYIEAISPTMNKFGFFNDGEEPHHWNWISEAHSRRYKFIDAAPAVIPKISMFEFDNTIIRLKSSGSEMTSYAIVREGKRHAINPKGKTAFDALFLALAEGMRFEHVDQTAWDSIPEGESWDKFCK